MGVPLGRSGHRHPGGVLDAPQGRDDPGRVRYWFLLLAVSYLYYASKVPSHVLILIALTLVGYSAGLALEAVEGLNAKRLIAGAGASLVLGVLVGFRVVQAQLVPGPQRGFFLGSDEAGGLQQIIVPLGLSFYTLRLVGYMIDRYHSRGPAERHPGIFALYVAFFPEVTAGPIDRAGDLLPQLRASARFDYTRIANGLKLVAWGIFKKVVVADRLGLLVDPVYRAPAGYQGLSLITATILFAFQIYCDFSAYSDIAIGIGEVLGFKLARNFDRPYWAQSISEFWRRWHMTLSTWLRDYVFLPIAYGVARRMGERAPLGITSEYWSYAAAVTVTMTLAGAWHGLRSTFLVWGALMGAFMVSSLATKKVRARWVRATGLNRVPRVRSAFRVGVVFFMVCMAWVVFRAESLGAALYIWTHLGDGLGSYVARVVTFCWRPRPGSGLLAPFLLGHPPGDLLVVIIALAVVGLVGWIQGREDARDALARWPAVVRWAVYYGLVGAILFFGVFETKTFIYARF